MSGASDSPRAAGAPLELEKIEAAAAAWLSLRDRGLGPEETAELMRWLQQDPRHAAVFAELDRVWKQFDRLDAVPAVASSAPEPDLLAPRPHARRARSFAWLAVGVAAAIAMMLTGLAWLSPARPSADTAIGAFQKIDLPDGSTAQLNTNSALETQFTRGERRIRVVRGEVFFHVAPDSTRPFIVACGPVAVRAVGTAFNVRQNDATIEVLVTEGRVSIEDRDQGRSLLPSSAAAAGEAPRMGAGERAIIPVSPAVTAGAATVERIPEAVARRALAWQERRLEFDNVPLGDVVREFNRYNRRQLVIADPVLSARRFSGTFRADGYESLVRLLENDFGVTAANGEREIVLRSAR